MSEHILSTHLHMHTHTKCFPEQNSFNHFHIDTCVELNKWNTFFLNHTILLQIRPSEFH